MARKVCFSVSMSLDGFIAPPIALPPCPPPSPVQSPGYAFPPAADKGCNRHPTRPA
jgi:hypothetical protein